MYTGGIIMAVQKVNVNFTNEFRGQLIGPRGTAEIGLEEGTVSPYDMLYGALASCLYSTFLDVAEKKRIKFESMNIEVTGEKREESPTILKWVNVKMIVKNADKEKGLIEAAELAAKYCSIYYTLAQIADMNLEIEFV